MCSFDENILEGSINRMSWGSNNTEVIKIPFEREDYAPL